MKNQMTHMIKNSCSSIIERIIELQYSIIFSWKQINSNIPFDSNSRYIFIRSTLDCFFHPHTFIRMILIRSSLSSEGIFYLKPANPFDELDLFSNFLLLQKEISYGRSHVLY